MIAVTGDDNSGDQAPMDSAGMSEAISVDDQTTDQAVTAESADDLTEGNAPAAAGAPTANDGADGAHTGDNGADASEDKATVPDLEQESEIAADYIEGLLDVADLDGDIDMDIEGDRPVVSVVGATLTELVGPKGEVLEGPEPGDHLEMLRLALDEQPAQVREPREHREVELRLRGADP